MMKKKMIAIISCVVLIFSSVLVVTAAMNGNYEKESTENSSKMLENDVEENISSTYIESDTKTTINNIEEETVEENDIENGSEVEENTATSFTSQN